MLKRASALFAVSLLVTLGFAKDKKNALPAYVLSAKTVAVIIDPSAGISIDDPRANQDAQKDVEAALLSWGRFEPVMSTQTADLIIVLRRGSGRMMNETMPDPRNDRVGAITPAGNGGSMGGQRGPQPGMVGGPGMDRASNLQIPRSARRTIRLLSTKAATKSRSKRPLHGGMWPWMALALIRFPLWQCSGRPWRTQKRPRPPRSLRTRRLNEEPPGPSFKPAC